MAWFPNGKPVYISGKWQTIWLKEAKSQTEILSRSGEMHFSTAIICATEAGPPPDGWKPEEEAE
jgi:hypothetical protein